MLQRILIVLLCIHATSLGASPAQAEQDTLAIWRLLDYIGVDYGEAVHDGHIVNADEYAEMTEFAAQVQTRLAQLPPQSQRAALQQQAAALASGIAQAAAPDEISRQAQALAGRLLAAYPATVLPLEPPELSAAPALYQAQCALCHGATGHGDGSAAAGLQPPPVDFHELARQRQRSLFALYGVISNGVEGTAMPAYPQLDDAQRWALAFHVGQLAYSDADRAQGARLWASAPAARAALPDLRALTQTSPAQLAALLGENDARALSAYLRAQPGVFATPAGDALTAAAARLDQALAAQRSGDRRRARDLALQAYLDHFEPVEPALAARDRALVHAVEHAMTALRAALESGADDARLQALADSAKRELQRAAAVLADDRTSAGGAFTASFIILFREGLEAMLVLVAMVTLVRRAERPDAMRHIHIGWLAGLALGVVTWLAATYFIDISGAERELTEAYTGLIAVAILLFVGLWMHGQSLSGRWQQYIAARIRSQLSRNRLWGLSLLAFVAVYREAFETVLFYRALWEQGEHAALFAGIGAAAALLAAVGWGMFAAGLRLPIAQFFQASAWLIGILAVVLAGKAVSAFQEAGRIGITPVHGPTLDWLGLYPTAQTLLAQLAVVAIVLAGIVWNLRRQSLQLAREQSSTP